MKTLKQIMRELTNLEKFENRLDAVVLDSIEHCVGNTYSPDALNAVHAYLLANQHTTLAARFREYVNATCPMFWNNKTNTFMLSRKQRDNAAELGPQWAAALAHNWRIKMDLNGEPKQKPKATLPQRVERALKAAAKQGPITTQEQNEALALLVASMSGAQIAAALGDKLDYVLAAAHIGYDSDDLEAAA